MQQFAIWQRLLTKSKPLSSDIVKHAHALVVSREHDCHVFNGVITNSAHDNDLAS